MKDRSAPVAANLLDRVIGWVSPREGARRMHARTVISALSGGYAGARRDRASTATMGSAPAGTDAVIRDLPTLRERARELNRDAPVAGAAIGITTAHVVGTGLSCHPKIDAEFLGLSAEAAEKWNADTQHRFGTWFESKDCDLERHCNGYQLQFLALSAVLESGDTFVITPLIERGGRKQLALQVVEADRVSNPGGSSYSSDPNLTDGIEHDPATGEPIAAHVCSRHPGDLTGGKREWQRIAYRGGASDRRNVLHLFRKIRPGLRRGVPFVAPIVDHLKQLADYTHAELRAAVVSGLNATFIEMDPKAFADLYGDNDDHVNKLIDRSTKWSGEIEGGRAINLLPGEKPHFDNPGRPNPVFDGFVTSVMRQIGMRLGIPYEVLVMHFQSSYSAARGALVVAWKFFRIWRDWLATDLCQPVYELWLAEEVAAGRIKAAGFFADPVIRKAWCGAQWVGDGPGAIDEEKAARAATERMANGTSTLEAESVLHDGIDWRTKHRQRVRELAARKADGMVAPAAAPAPGRPAPPAQPAEEEQADDTTDTDQELT